MGEAHDGNGGGGKDGNTATRGGDAIRGQGIGATPGAGESARTQRQTSSGTDGKRAYPARPHRPSGHDKRVGRGHPQSSTGCPFLQRRSSLDRRGRRRNKMRPSLLCLWCARHPTATVTRPPAPPPQQCLNWACAAVCVRHCHPITHLRLRALGRVSSARAQGALGEGRLPSPPPFLPRRGGERATGTVAGDSTKNRATWGKRARACAGPPNHTYTVLRIARSSPPSPKGR